MQDPYIGQIMLCPYQFAPLGWIDCAGQLLPISQYTALFSLIGTYYGGNGTTNFALPDLQGRVPLSMGQSRTGSTYSLGETSGVEQVTLTTNTMASHSHSLNAITTSGTTNAPAGGLLARLFVGSARGGTSGDIYNSTTTDTALVQNSISLSTGGNQPHPNVQPFLVLRYCIAIAGVFPPRS
jgi:microcystin-dependent protein